MPEKVPIKGCELFACVHSRGHSLIPGLYETLPECLSQLYLDRIHNWVRPGQNLHVGY